MFKRIVFIVLVLFSFHLKAQNKGIVIDNLGTPIPYVNIWVDGENIGTSSQEDGTFIINCSKDKVLVFSAVGFETKKTTLNIEGKIILKSKIFELNEVEISKFKNSKEYETNDSKKRFYLPEPQTIPWILGRKFSSKDDFRYIKNLIFYTNSEVENGIFKVRIFSIGEDGLPEDDILSEEILVEVKKGKQKTIIDVLKFNIKIPEQGIVVAFESLLINQNKYMQKNFNSETRKRFKSLNYSPHILYFYNSNLESYIYRAGNWKHFSKDFYKKHNNFKLPIAAIDLILTN